MDKKALRVEDIFSLLQPDSVVRSVFCSEELVLDAKVIPSFRPDSTYTSKGFKIKPDQETSNKIGELLAICEQSEGTTGKKKEFILPGVYEAFRNAYQHGNRKDPQKEITVSYRAIDDAFEVVVSDQGGKLNPNFVPFVLLHRFSLPDTPISFYDYSLNTIQSPENSGIGTFVMHTIADEVNYYTNSDGGLSVQLIVRKK